MDTTIDINQKYYFVRTRDNMRGFYTLREAEELRTLKNLRSASGPFPPSHVIRFIEAWGWKTIRGKYSED
jgi:hypothetical protein